MNNGKWVLIRFHLIMSLRFAERLKHVDQLMPE